MTAYAGFVLGLGLVCSFSSYARVPLSAHDVQERIGSEGAKATVAYLDQANEWDAVVERIGKGDSEWIAVAAQLATGTDAGDSEDLGISLAQALPHNPLAVLQVMDIVDESGVVGVDRVCGVPFIETTRAFNKAYLRRAIPAVSHVQAADLIAKRDKCLARLKS